jgi:hypothetical protein
VSTRWAGLLAGGEKLAGSSTTVKHISTIFLQQIKFEKYLHLGIKKSCYVSGASSRHSEFFPFPSAAAI